MTLEPRDRVSYSAMPDRSPIEWPGGARVALWISPNVEHYQYLPDPNPQRDPYNGRLPHPDIREYSFRDYGNRVGIWRMADVLSDYPVRPTVSLNLAVLDLFPEIAELIVKQRWAVMSHGIYNTDYLWGLSEDAERAFYVDCIDTLHRHTGLQLRGMLGPAISGNLSTPDLMAEAGLVYHADWVHDDQPVAIETATGRMISIPYSYELDDAPMFFKNYDGEYFLDICRRQLDRLRKDARETGLVMCIALHPFEIGQPHNIDYLRQILDYVLSFDDVWPTTGDEIAQYYLDHFHPGSDRASAPISTESSHER